MRLKLEYIWLDGYTPEPNLRSKIKIYDRSETPETLENPLYANFSSPSPEDLPFGRLMEVQRCRRRGILLTVF